MTEILTKRMKLYPITDEEMQKLIDDESDEEMKIAYGEMLDGCKKNPKMRIWNAVWLMKDNLNGKTVGDYCFKGLNDGVVEIGYGIKKEYEGQGLMTEAVIAASAWASTQEGVKVVEAETDPGNAASQRVLQKAGYIPNGIMGEEGPRFVYKPQIRNN